MIKAAEQQKLRQLKKLVQLKRKAEQQLQLQREWEVKQEMQEAREQMRALETYKLNEESASKCTLLESRRREVRAAAELRQADARAAVEAKLAADEERSELHKARQGAQRDLIMQRIDEKNERRRQIKQQGELRMQDQQVR